MGTPNASVVVLKRVDDLGFYSLGRDQVAEQVALSGPKTSTIIDYLEIQKDPECFKKIVIGKSAKFNRYSIKAVVKIKEFLKSGDKTISEVWVKYGQKYRGQKSQTREPVL